VPSVPMSPKEYREFAAQCLRWAVRAKSDEHKSAMLKMAHHWTQTAEKLEHAAEPYWTETEATSVYGSLATTQRPEHSNSGEK
jgi:hypothetical protein